MSNTSEQSKLENLDPINVAEAEALLADAGEGHMYGLGVDVLAQEVTFGEQVGSVAKMLTDMKCPVGGMIKKAYEEDGREGVVEKFDKLGELDSAFSIHIPDHVPDEPSAAVPVPREQVKKKPLNQR